MAVYRSYQPFTYGKAPGPDRSSHTFSDCPCSLLNDTRHAVDSEGSVTEGDDNNTYWICLHANWH